MPASRLRFGIFEFDLATRELRRNGIPVRLQAQPAQVLAELLAHPDQVVPREALRQAVWGAETFVDFDRGLNFCIAQIRSALGDSAESPCFVRTMPKRGYQFIAPIMPVDAPAPTPVATIPSSAAPVARRRWLWPSVAALFLALSLFLLAQRFWHPRATERIAVTRFENETGDPALDRFADGLTDSVVADLTSVDSGRYGIIGNAAILRVPRKQRNLKAIAAELKVRYVVLGQVQGNASHPRVLVHLIRVPEQTHLWVTRRDDVSLADVSRVQSEMSQRVAAEFSQKLASQKSVPN